MMDIELLLLLSYYSHDNLLKDRQITGSVLMIIFQYLLFHHYFPAVLDIDALGGLASQATALQVE